jgi:hypothetical protein
LKAATSEELQGAFEDHLAVRQEQIAGEETEQIGKFKKSERP